MEGGVSGETDAMPEADALEFTPTWIVAGVCSLIVVISLAVERFLHYIGKTLKKKNQKALFEALLKVKEELMLLGFISLLLTVSQGVIQRTCIPPSWTNYMLPCKKMDAHTVTAKVLALGVRRLLSERGPRSEHCQNKGKVPLLSPDALHQLHIFIFVLAITHVILSAVTMFLGGEKIRQWKRWEDEIEKNAGTGSKKLTHVQQFEFIRENFNGVGKESMILSWMHSFAKQFYASVTKSDYTTMRLGFIMTHCRGNPKFHFHRYMVRALEADFKKVVGIRWYLWIFVVIFMLLNVNGLHTYFWISFIPLILLLAVGTKLEHVIAQLAHEVAEKHSAIEGDLVVNPSDEHFWCARPRVILYLIHFILFQNAFEIALFFWMLTTYGFNSCIMDHVPLIVPRLVIGVVIQLLCSYSTLPLYAIVTQMGTFFKKEIFDEHIQQGLVGWAQKAKRRTESIKDGAGGGTHGPSSGLEMLRRAAAAIQGSRAPQR
ncbi:MLO-like protein 1 isoform X2 [Lolium perenne]|uniref:MLO-like protein 1 isoform X2 n=1 Tax=Lolium perenne TaxID=4522 RepID=UPI0021F63C79|nr:MLO-like protein 1 isoform X2 [Lolium perenne]